jgi:ribose transport system substrate-binding protein
MRKRNITRLVGAALAVGLASASLVACASSGMPLNSDTAASKQFTIGVLVPEENQNAYSASYSANIKKKAESLGVKITVLNSDYNAATQQSQMDQLIAQKVDGIILWPAVAGTTSTMLLAAKKAGIPVNISNSVVSADEKDLYKTFTGPSDTRIGENQADIVNTLLNGKGNAIIIEGQPGNSAAAGRLNGFKDQIASKAPGITILGSQPGNWQQAEAQTATSNLLTRFGDQVNVVVTADDVMAAGAAQAISNAGLTGKVLLVGSGYYEVTPPLMKSGQQTATLFQSPCWDAVHAMKEMLAVLNGETVDKEYLMPVPEVTKDNMGDFTPMGCLPGDEL